MFNEEFQGFICWGVRAVFLGFIINSKQRLDFFHPPYLNSWLTFYHYDNKTDIWYTEVSLFNAVPLDFMTWAWTETQIMSCEYDVTMALNTSLEFHILYMTNRRNTGNQLKQLWLRLGLG